MTTSKPRPEADARPHTELRRRGQAPAPDAAPATAPGLQPRTSPETIRAVTEDGADDLFNDMPV